MNIKYSYRTHWRWILGAVLVGFAGSVIYATYPSRFGNFLIHSSGGVSSTLLFIYLLKTLKLDFNWRIATAMLFGFVCGLGVLNELAEYFFELVGVGTFSFDSHDTWRDLLANTTGALIAWIIYLGYSLTLKSSPKLHN